MEGGFMKRTGLILLISGFWLLVCGYYTNTHAQQETLTLLTYYPAPYGVYQIIQIGQTGHFLTIDYNSGAPTGHRISSSNTDDIIFSHNGTANDLVVDVNGNVGIRTNNPRALLEINGTMRSTGSTSVPDASGAGIEIYYNSGSGAGTINAYDRSNSYKKLEIYGNPTTINESIGGLGGYVGIGINNPTERLDVNGAIKLGDTAAAIPTAGTIRWNGTSFQGHNGTTWVGLGGIGGIGTTNYIPKFTDSATLGDSAIYEDDSQICIGTTTPKKSRLTVESVKGDYYSAYFIGKQSGVGWIYASATPAAYAGHFQGNVKVDGYVYAVNVDISEYISASQILEPGDVVVIDPNNDCSIITSNKSYDSTIAGIVSTDPAFILGVNSEKGNENEAKIAIAGRVPCKVDASYGEIKPGDLLTSSPTTGHAMKLKPIGKIKGHQIYPQGCIIGKALQGLKEGKGKILVLVCLM